MMRREDYAWAAGLYEGEGSIYIRRRKTDPSLQIVIQITQCGDEGRPVLDHFRDVVAVGNVTGPYANGGNFLKRSAKPLKPRYTYSIAGLERVQAVIAMLWPWLSDRRKARMSECLIEYVDYQRNLRNPHRSGPNIINARKTPRRVAQGGRPWGRI